MSYPRLLAALCCLITMSVANAKEAGSSAINKELARHDFPYPSHYVEVNGSHIHYVDTGGEGTAIVMVHGQPTWSYLWRNVIPEVESGRRVIALDLIGFGKSDKPFIDYSLEDHETYFDGFMQSIKAEKVILVLHDWGSWLGLDWARKNPERVAGLAFFEAVLPHDGQFDQESEQYQIMARFLGLLEQFNTPGLGERMILRDNFFVERILMPALCRYDLDNDPENCVRSDDAAAAYREPFAGDANRYAMLQFPRLAYGFRAADTRGALGLEQYTRYLAETQIPMLYLTFRPGGINGPHNERWLRANVDDLTVKPIGRGVHFVQENHPSTIGRSLREWLTAKGL